MFCALFRNNTEKNAVIFGEKNQFCIVYFNLNKMWIFFKKKKKEKKFLNSYNPITEKPLNYNTGKQRSWITNKWDSSQIKHTIIFLIYRDFSCDKVKYQFIYKYN
jgi:hypothetical protein